MLSEGFSMGLRAWKSLFSIDGRCRQLHHRQSNNNFRLHVSTRLGEARPKRNSTTLSFGPQAGFPHCRSLARFLRLSEWSRITWSSITTKTAVISASYAPRGMRSDGLQYLHARDQTVVARREILPSKDACHISPPRITARRHRRPA